MTMATERSDRSADRMVRRGENRPGIAVFFSRAQTQWRVIRALMIRDMMSRYGRENIGFLWLIGEPVLLIGGIIILWSIMKGSATHGISVITFALTGYSMLTLWRHLITRGTTALRLNTGLLFHQNVRVLDTIAAQILMEVFFSLVSFLLCYLVLYLLGYVEMVYDPLTMAMAWILMSLFGAGFALCLGGIVEASKAFERMLQPIMYFTLPLTGAFYLVDWMPEKARSFLLLFPMVHAQEMFRAGFIGPRLTFYYDGWYLFLWGIISLGIGLTVIKRAERHLHVG